MLLFRRCIYIYINFQFETFDSPKHWDVSRSLTCCQRSFRRLGRCCKSLGLARVWKWLISGWFDNMDSYNDNNPDWTGWYKLFTVTPFIIREPRLVPQNSEKWSSFLQHSGGHGIRSSWPDRTRLTRASDKCRTCVICWGQQNLSKLTTQRPTGISTKECFKL